MKKSMIAATTVATGLVFAAAPAAVAADNYILTPVDGGCQVTLTGFTPGEKVMSGAHESGIPNADANGSVMIPKVLQQGQELGVVYVGAESGHKVGFQSDNIVCNTASNSSNVENPTQAADEGQASSAQAQDNTATSTTAGVAKSNDNALVVGGAATVAFVGAGTFVASRKKA